MYTKPKTAVFCDYRRKRMKTKLKKKEIDARHTALNNA